MDLTILFLNLLSKAPLCPTSKGERTQAGGGHVRLGRQLVRGQRIQKITYFFNIKDTWTAIATD